MSIALAVVTDGRDDCLGQTLVSLEALISGMVVERWMFDDTGSPRHVGRMAALYPSWTILTARTRQGFGGAYAHLWKVLAAKSRAEWVFSTEDDFLFTRPVDLDAMAAVLTDTPRLAQMALRRQAWNSAERAAGGVVELHPEAYTDWADGHGHHWLEHSLFWTTNPSLYRRDLCAVGWPTGTQSEGMFTCRLLTDGLPWGIPGSEVRFGYWGPRTDPPWIEHIGTVRVGVGY